MALTTKQILWAAFMRFLRVMSAQSIGFWADATMGISIPWVGISIGAGINMLVKVLRDKFPGTIDWLPL